MSGGVSRERFLRSAAMAALAAGARLSGSRPAYASGLAQARNRTQELRIVHGGGTSSTNLPTLDVTTTGATLAILSTWQYQTGLFYLAGDNQLHKGLVDTYLVSDDGLTFTFNLLGNLRWSDGSTFSAYDIEYSWTRAALPATKGVGAGTALNDIQGIDEVLSGAATTISGLRVVDGSTFEVRLKRPNSAFLAKLGIPWGSGWVKKEALEANPDAYFSGQNGFPLGNGPMKLDRWIADDRVIFSRNPYFHGEPSNLDTLHLLFNRDSSTQLVAYENNELDLTAVDTADVERFNARGLPHFGELRNSISGTDFLCFKPGLPPMDDPLVRLAFYQAIDREAIVKGPFKGLWKAATSIFAPDFPWYDPEPQLPKYDPDAARANLARSKYGAARNLPPLHIGGSTLDSYQRATVAVQQMWKDVLGVTSDIKMTEFPYEAAAQKRQVYITGRGYLMTDLNWMPYSVWETEGAFNKVVSGVQQTDNSYQDYYKNPEIDAVIYKAAATLDPVEQAALYHSVEAMVVKAVYTLPLFHESAYALVKPWVMGYMPRANFNESYGLPPSNVWIAEHR
jgi:oligopeptide transport system substrate-binding protein